MRERTEQSRGEEEALCNPAQVKPGETGARRMNSGSGDLLRRGGESSVSVAEMYCSSAVAKGRNA